MSGIAFLCLTSSSAFASFTAAALRIIHRASSPWRRLRSSEGDNANSDESLNDPDAFCEMYHSGHSKSALVNPGMERKRNCSLLHRRQRRSNAQAISEGIPDRKDSNILLFGDASVYHPEVPRYSQPFCKTSSQAFTNVRNRPLYLEQDEELGVRGYVGQ